MNEPISAPLALRPRDAARVLSISTRHLWQLTKNGLIPCVYLGRGKRRITLYSVDVLKAWLSRESDKSKGGSSERQ
jgi:predicted site-specific integrase-resolvase